MLKPMNTPNPNKKQGENQKEKIINYLMTHGPLTVLEAMQYLKVYALSQRIGELSKEGFPIQKEMIQVDSGKRIARYYLTR
jgi:hypothetical protein